MILRWTVAATFVFAMWTPLVGATDLGDPAPPLKIKKWVKGEAVDLKSGKDQNVFVLEFWATWCRPCIKGIPHLTEIQKEFKDKGVIVVGISDESPGKVEPFVKKMGDKMGYVVAADDGQATTKAYMGAFGIQGIPHAFIIDKSGAIAWHGHPMGMDGPLEQITSGTYDIEAAKKALKAYKWLPKYFGLVTKSSGEDDAEKAAKLGKKILKYGSKDAQLMNQFAWTILTEPRIENRDINLALKAARAAYKACDRKDAAILDTYARALWDSDKKTKAIKAQKKAVRLCKDEQMLKGLKETLERYKKEAPDGEG